VRCLRAEVPRNSGRICALRNQNTAISCKQFCLQERIILDRQLNLQSSLPNLCLIVSSIGPIQSCTRQIGRTPPWRRVACCQSGRRRAAFSPPPPRQPAAVRLFCRRTEPACGPFELPKRGSSGRSRLLPENAAACRARGAPLPFIHRGSAHALR